MVRAGPAKELEDRHTNDVSAPLWTAVYEPGGRGEYDGLQCPAPTATWARGCYLSLGLPCTGTVFGLGESGLPDTEVLDGPVDVEVSWNRKKPLDALLGSVGGDDGPDSGRCDRSRVRV
ncbi:hypothetical protein GCM10009754_01400 [Amycolatopsis minnesotensis]|uniref:Uncharacterized protein n=1 Tax=Amycolatopsis minnesotensis TaxID=337894 RepID=A0ABN2PXU7_9PSEU